MNMYRASSSWASPTIREIGSDQRTVLFQYHTRDTAGTHVLEYRHSFPNTLFGHVYPTDEYFEAFRTRVDPMQNHMDDCLNYSNDLCCICAALPTKRVLLATKYILNTNNAVVKNLTAAVCSETECEHAAASAMKRASEQLERQFDSIEINLWPTPIYKKSKRPAAQSTALETGQDETPPLSSSSLRDRKVKEPARPTTKSSRPELKDFQPTKLSSIPAEEGDHRRATSLTSDFRDQTTDFTDDIPFILKRSQSADVNTGIYNPHAARSINDSTFQERCIAPLCDSPTLQEDDTEKMRLTKIKKLNHLGSYSSVLSAPRPHSPVDDFGSLIGFMETMDLICAAREGPRSIKPTIKKSSDADTILRRGVDVLDAGQPRPRTSTSMRKKRWWRPL